MNTEEISLSMLLSVSLYFQLQGRPLFQCILSFILSERNLRIKYFTFCCSRTPPAFLRTNLQTPSDHLNTSINAGPILTVTCSILAHFLLPSLSLQTLLAVLQQPGRSQLLRGSRFPHRMVPVA